MTITFPLIGIGGPAGSGKDALRDAICAELTRLGHRPATVSLADPMKRLAARVMEFAPQHLWGGSAERATPYPAYDQSLKAWREARERLAGYSFSFCREVGAPDPGEASNRLLEWFDDLRVQHTGSANLDPETNQLKNQMTPRRFLQLLGTEWGRAVDVNLWIRHLVDVSRRLLTEDLRYDREAGLQGSDLPQTHVLCADVRFRNEVLAIRQAGGLTVLVQPRGRAGDVQGGVVGHRSEAELGGVPATWWSRRVVNDRQDGQDALTVSAYFIVQPLVHDYTVKVDGFEILKNFKDLRDFIQTYEGRRPTFPEVNG